MIVGDHQPIGCARSSNWPSRSVARRILDCRLHVAVALGDATLSAASRQCPRPTPDHAPAADELEHDFAPVRPRRGARQDRCPARCRAPTAADTGTCSDDAGEHGFDMRRHVVRPSTSCTQPASAGASRSSAVTRSVRTSGSAFSWMTSEAEVCRMKSRSRSVARARLRHKARGLVRDLDKALARVVDGQRRGRDRSRRASYGSATDRLTAKRPRCAAQLLFRFAFARSRSSRPAAARPLDEAHHAVDLGIARAIAACGSPCARCRGSGSMPAGNGRPRASRSFLSAAFSVCSRAISFSSAARSSGTAWQAQPTVRRLHSETCAGAAHRAAEAVLGTMMKVKRRRRSRLRRRSGRAARQPTAAKPPMTTASKPASQIMQRRHPLPACCVCLRNAAAMRRHHLMRAVNRSRRDADLRQRQCNIACGAVVRHQLRSAQTRRRRRISTSAISAICFNRLGSSRFLDLLYPISMVRAASGAAGASRSSSTREVET